ncbi:outer membrane protein B [Chlamydia pecorum VR629]|nr:outer membrane protein B [Chlamydia pecorum VR629]UJT76588.1 Outer membrane protein B precursor [Chlamydia pecorum]
MPFSLVLFSICTIFYHLLNKALSPTAHKATEHMNSKLLKSLRLVTLCVFALLGTSTSSLYAMPAGNPAFPVLPGINSGQHGWCMFHLCDSKDLFTALSGSLKVGFCGDFIYSESAHVTDVPVITSVTTIGVGTQPTIISTTKTYNFDVMNASTHSSSAFASVSLQEHSPAMIPLLDISFTVRIGGIKQHYRLPLNAYRDFTSSPLNAESEVTDGIIELQSNYGFIWDLSLDKVLWKDGVSFIGAGVSYRQASAPVNYIVVYNKTNPEVYFDSTDGSLNYKEWSAHFGLTTYLNDYILPYLGISIGNSTRKAPKDSFKKLEEQFTNFKFQVRDITNFDKTNFYCGATCCISDNFFYNVESRWGYQRAISVMSGFQF